MKDCFIVVFPTNKQIKYLMLQNIENLFVVLQNDKTEYDFSLNLINHINKDEISKKINYLKKFRVKVLCCHEEAIYWICLYGSERWTYQFNHEYFNLLEKNKFKDFISDKDINNAKYYLNKSSIEKFPVIAKPIIGFGSIGVKTLNSKEQVNNYIQKFDSMIENSIIKKYQNIYFKYKSNRYIFEKKIEGEFYRTPFILDKEKKKWIFPIKGKGTLAKSNSDYHWNDFEYSDQEKHIAAKVAPLFDSLINIFELMPGVYVAEFIISKDGDVYLLEFSPRQTSSRIAKIIELATGIDLEISAIDLFLGRNIKKIKYNKCIRLRIGRNDDVFNEKGLYRVYLEEKDKNIYEDRTVSRYYVRL